MISWWQTSAREAFLLGLRRRWCCDLQVPPLFVRCLGNADTTSSFSVGFHLSVMRGFPSASPAFSWLSWQRRSSGCLGIISYLGTVANGKKRGDCTQGILLGAE